MPARFEIQGRVPFSWSWRGVLSLPRVVHVIAWSMPPCHIYLLQLHRTEEMSHCAANVASKSWGLGKLGTGSNFMEGAQNERLFERASLSKPVSLSELHEERSRSLLPYA